MEEQITPNATIIPNQWWWKFRKFNDSDLLSLMDAIFKFTENPNESPCFDSPYIEAVWTTIEPILKSKIKAYRTKVENGMKGGAPVGNQNARKDITKDEKQSFVKILFFKNVPNPEAEALNFINYYRANGWKRNNGARIKDKISACKEWKPKQDGKLFSDSFMNFWQSVCATIPAIDEHFNEVKQVEITSDKVIISCSENIVTTIESHLDKFKPLYIQHFDRKQFSYKILRG